MVTPFSQTELTARARSVLRQPSGFDYLGQPEKYVLGDLVIHEQLLQRVWGPGNSGDAGLALTVVQRLRRKFGADAHNPRYIFTEPRVAYRVEKPSST